MGWKMNKFLLILGVLSVFLIAACGQQTTTTTTTTQPVPAPGVEPGEVEETVVAGDDDLPEEPTAPADEPAEADTSDVKEFDITAKRWDFTPATITVKEGDKVKLNINSIDVTHGFVLSAFGVNEQLVPGKTVSVEFVANKKGTHTFFCNVFCGSGHGGMNGKLIVE